MVMQIKKIYVKMCLYLSEFFGNQAMKVLCKNTKLLDQYCINKLDNINLISVTL